MTDNRLYFGDNLQVLRDDIVDETVDLIYLDPPFNSKATYNVLFRAPGGEQSQAQIEAFEDTWHWTDEAERAFGKVMDSGNTNAAEMVRSMRSFLGENDMMAYLTMMAVRLLELHRVLKPTGSLYLHCDPTASHYLKMLLDAIFAPKRFLNEICWKRASAHSDTKQGMKRCGRIRDLLLVYTKTGNYTWNPIYLSYKDEYIESEYRHQTSGGRNYKETDVTAAKPGGNTEYEWPVKRLLEKDARWEADLSEEFRNPNPEFEYKTVSPYKGRYWAYSKTHLVEFAKEGKLIHRNTGMPRLIQFSDEMPGIPLQDLWTDIPPESGANFLGYPTQKPERLLERIILSSSNEGDLVLDPFCGCGTTIHAAQKLGRRWFGIDVTHLAISLIEKRIKDAFPDVKYDVYGMPKDIYGAQALAAADKYQFQWWAVSLVNAHPFGGKKKGADTGIDGVIYFKPDGKTTERALISVKGGERVNVGMIRDLVGVINREKAPIGLFITLASATKNTIAEAASAGQYETEFGKYPRVQILTIVDLFNGKKPAIPFIDPAMFKKAPKVDTTKQEGLFQKD